MRTLGPQTYQDTTSSMETKLLIKFNLSFEELEVCDREGFFAVRMYYLNLEFPGIQNAMCTRRGLVPSFGSVARFNEACQWLHAK